MRINQIQHNFIITIKPIRDGKFFLRPIVETCEVIPRNRVEPRQKPLQKSPASARFLHPTTFCPKRVDSIGTGQLKVPNSQVQLYKIRQNQEIKR